MVQKKLESTFAEILLKGKKNITVDCIYKHPFLGIEEFNVLFGTSYGKDFC